MIDPDPIRSLAGRILSDDTASPEAKRLAAYVLGDADDRRTSDQSEPPIDIPGQ